MKYQQVRRAQVQTTSEILSTHPTILFPHHSDKFSIIDAPILGKNQITTHHKKLMVASIT